MRTIKQLREGIDEVKRRNNFSYTSFYVSRPYYPDSRYWYVMVRTHDLGGTSYGYTFRMNEVEVRKVVKAGILEPWFVHKDFFKETVSGD